MRELWSNHQLDEEYYRHFVEISLKLLESKPLLKDSEVKGIIFEILEFVLNEHSEAFKNVQLKLINIIYEDESIIQQISDFLVKAYKSEKEYMVQLASETLKMLVSYMLEKTNVKNEDQAIKNTKECICLISKQIPKVFNHNLQTFMKLYDSESYLLRQALNEILTNIIQQVLSLSERDDHEASEHYINNKRKLLDALIIRIHDKNAYSRMHVLGVLTQLCQENVVPFEYLQILLKKACERIQDVSAFVRRKTLNLINILVQQFYFVFVESSSKSGFLTQETLEREISLIDKDIEQFSLILQEIDQEIKQLEGNELEKFDSLIEKQKKFIKKQEHKMQDRQKFEDYQIMLRNLADLIPFLIQLLGSKNNCDVIETIKLILILKQTNIKDSEIGLRKMLVLIWSKEKQIKEEIIQTYWQLYLSCQQFDNKTVAQNLVDLFNHSSLSEITSLEELLIQIMNWNQNLDEKDKERKKNIYGFQKSLFTEIWSIFMECFQSELENEKINRRSSFLIFRIFSSRCNEIAKERFDNFQEIIETYQNSKIVDWIVMKELGIIIQNICDVPQNQIINLIQLYIHLIINHFGTSDSEWFCACEQIITIIFKLLRNPENVGEFLIKKCSYMLFNENESESLCESVQAVQKEIKTKDISKQKSHQKKNLLKQIKKQQMHNYENQMAQLLFIVGQVALKMLLSLENIENDLKLLKMNAEQKKEEQIQEETQELDKIQGGIEGEFEKRVENLHQIGENYIIQKNLISRFVPLILQLCQEILNGERAEQNNILNRVAVQTLCKMMCVSGQFCQEHLPLLFKFLDNSQLNGLDSVIKENILISLGDFIHRHPNIVEPFTQFFYQNLKDPNPSVRKTTLMVITHLILNDMLKLKSEICDVALLFDDPDSKIQNLIRLFFHELHKKDNKMIYNLLPESIGRLSAMSNVNFEIFQKFAKNIMPYLEKEKYSEILVEKLCQRFKFSSNSKEWRNSAFCLSQLAYNEKGLNKLIEMFECYRDKLHDPNIMEEFKLIISKAKKLIKQDFRNLVDEFESKILNYHKDQIQEERQCLFSRKKKAKKDQPQKIVDESEELKHKGLKTRQKVKVLKRKASQDFSDTFESQSDQESPVQKSYLMKNQRQNVTQVSKRTLRPHRQNVPKNYYYDLDLLNSDQEEMNEENEQDYN